MLSRRRINKTSCTGGWSTTEIEITLPCSIALPAGGPAAGHRDQRRRAGGDQSGLGPMTFTTVAAQQRFRAWFRIAGDPAARAELAGLLARLLDGQVIALGSGEQNAYVGDPLFQVGSLVDGPPGLPAAALLGQAAEVDIVLRTPALVTDLGTGHYRPDALADHVEQLVLGSGMSGRVI